MLKTWKTVVSIFSLSLLVALGTQQARAQVIISEFMADNSAGLEDENGETSDWIEIYNLTSATVNLSGWHLTDEIANLQKWTFPSFDLEPGDFLVVFASEKNRTDPTKELHTNFALSSGGDYLALVKPDGTISHDYFPVFPPQLPNISFGRVQQTSILIDEGDNARYVIPTSETLSTDWASITFNDSAWPAGEMEIGFGGVNLPGTVGYWTFDEPTGSVLDHSGNGNHGTRVGGTEIVPGGKVGSAIQLDGSSGYVTIPNESQFDLQEAITISAWFKVRFNWTRWQGLVTKGDSSWRLHRNNWSNSLAFHATNVGSPAGSININNDQWHHAVATYDGSNMSLYIDGQLDVTAAAGATIPNVDYPVWIGNNSESTNRHWNGQIDEVRILNRGLNAEEVVDLYNQKVDGATTNIADEMKDINASLLTRQIFQVEEPGFFAAMQMRVKYEDGFVAYLNGQKVAESNAPESPAWNSAALSDREDKASNEFDTINLMPFVDLLTTGTNVLAIHSMNDSADNEKFLIAAQLSAAAQLHSSQFFIDATPGGFNKGGAIDQVADTRFSHKRGFYNEPFSVTITSETPDSTIRYTLNGSEPTFTNGIEYTAPIPISRTSTLRAVAFKTGWLATNVDTQTYIFIADVKTQSPTGARPGSDWPSGSVNGQEIDYGMDPDIVNSPQYGDKIEAALLAIPTLSITTDVDNLFDASTGIYVNALQKGMSWERPASLELLNPDGSDGFHLNMGLRIRGGYSRNDGNPKHAFRFFFRDIYGTPALNYPLFEDEGAESFKKMDLRTAQNYSWSFKGDGSLSDYSDNGARNTFIREVLGRDLQGMSGQLYTRSRYYHLYLNGVYWGLFMTQERAGADHATTYLGGKDDDYDVVKPDSNSHQVYATSGNMNAYKKLWDLAKKGFSNDTNYYRALGCNPDGTRNPDYEVMVDEVNLAEYMLIIYYTGNFDAPISDYLSNSGVNNFYCAYNRADSNQGWKFYVHDGEHTFMPDQMKNGAGIDRTGPYPAGNDFATFNPQWLHQEMAKNTKYRTLFADVVQRRFFNGGSMTPESVRAIAQARAKTIETAIIAESARWGDAKSNTPRTQSSWQSAVNEVVNSIIPGRTARVLQQLKSKGWYPTLNAPTMTPFGGRHPRGTTLTLTNGIGITYYTTNGSDPRLATGDNGVSNDAVEYTGALTLNESQVIKACTLSGSTWSALVEASYLVNVQPTAENLVVSEINYNPSPPTVAEQTLVPNLQADEFEFIELLNIGTEPIDLAGVALTDGIEFEFILGSQAFALAPGARLVLAKNPTVFALRYNTNGMNLAGPYSGFLRNSGETLEVVDNTGLTILRFEYGDGGSWPQRGDGKGSSIELKDTTETSGTLGNSNAWRSSAEYNGSPGYAGSGPINSIVINEVLAHTDPPLLDTIELFNPTTQTIDLSMWYLSDSSGDYFKYSIIPGTILHAGEYITFDESHFNPTPLTPGPKHFALNGTQGDDVYLLAADPAGKPTRFIDHVDFGASANGESFGRWENATGSLYPSERRTLGEENSPPRVGPLFISEVHYNPPNDIDPLVENIDMEFIEITNPLPSPMNLTNWRIRKGIDFDFPEDTILNPAEALVVVSFDPVTEAGKLQTFRDNFTVAAQVQILGPYSGRLDNAGEKVQLQRPDLPPIDDPDLIPHLIEDEADYNDTAPWPTPPDGEGESLNRAAYKGFGNDPASWTSAAPTPGDVLMDRLEFPTALGLAPQNDTGVSTNDRITNIATNLSITGEAADGMNVLLIEGDTILTSGTASEFVSGLAIPTTLTNGTHTIAAIASDPATSEKSYPSLPFSFTLDASAPTVSSTTLSTTNSAQNTAVDFTIGFSESVFGFDAPEDVTVLTQGTVAYTNIAIAQTTTMLYTATINGLSGNGSISLVVNSNACIDLAGNANAESTPSPIATIGADVLYYALTTTATGGTIAASTTTTLLLEGTSVELTAIPNTGYDFVQWSGDTGEATPTSNPITIVMDADKSVQALCSIQTFALSKAVTHGSIALMPNLTVYPFGTTVTVTVTPDEYYSLQNWTGDVPVSSNTLTQLTILMDSDKSLEAIIIANGFFLTTTATNGSITQSPLSPVYAPASKVNLTATPAANHKFVGWSGDASGQDNPLFVTMDSNKSITALFAPLADFTLTISPDAGGTIDASPAAPTHQEGSLVTLEATPFAGYQFTGWTNDATGQTNPLMITMDSDKTFGAIFALRTYPLTLTALNGSITLNPSKAIYEHGSQVELRAIPDLHYHFTGWTGDIPDGHEISNPLPLTIISPTAVVANFAIDSFTLIATADEGGSVQTDPDQTTYDYGASTSITAIADDGYQFTGWSGDVSAQQAETNPLVLTVETDTTVKAYFRALPQQANYLVSYRKCSVTIDDNQNITISDSTDKSTIKIVALKTVPKNTDPKLGKSFYVMGLHAIPSLTIDGPLGKLSTDAEIWSLTSNSTIKKITTKKANILAINAVAIASIKLTALANSDEGEFAGLSILTNGSGTMKASISGAIVENLVTSQTIKSLSLTTKAWKTPSKTKTWSLGGLGAVADVQTAANGNAMVITPGASSLQAPTLTTLKASGAPIAIDEMLAGFSRITVQGGAFKTTAVVPIHADLIANYLISLTPVKRIVGKAKKVSGQAIGGNIGIPGAPASTNIRVSGDTASLSGNNISAIIWAGFDGATQTYSGTIKKIAAKQTLEGEAHVSSPPKVKAADQNNFTVITQQ